MFGTNECNNSFYKGKGLIKYKKVFVFSALIELNSLSKVIFRKNNKQIIRFIM